MLVEAGRATDDRISNLKQRSAKHTKSLATQKKLFKRNYGSMSEAVVQQLTDITYAILDYMMKNKEFSDYLKNLLIKLKSYAGNDTPDGDYKNEQILVYKFHEGNSEIITMEIGYCS